MNELQVTMKAEFSEDMMKRLETGIMEAYMADLCKSFESTFPSLKNGRLHSIQITHVKSVVLNFVLAFDVADLNYEKQLRKGGELLTDPSFQAVGMTAHANSIIVLRFFLLAY